MSKRPLKPSQDDAIEALLARSKRHEVPIRTSFLQQGEGKVRKPGPLAAMLLHRDRRALDLYLLIHAVTSADPFDVALPSATWARLLGLSDAGPSNLSTVSKALRRIKLLKLIDRGRAGRLSKVTLLHEGGSGESYVHPSKHRERYFKLRHEYWLNGWHRNLGLPAKVMLLIALSLDDGFYLPIEKGRDWYGISADTVQRGLATLRDEGLLDVEEIHKKAPLSAVGYTIERTYTLKPPFGPLRKSAKAKAKQHPSDHSEVNQ